MLDLKNKLCIFDCDGTLVDTEPLIAKSWKVFFKKYFNVVLTEEDYFDHCHGQSPKNMCDYFNDKFDINLDFSGEIKEKKRAITQELIRNELKPIVSVSNFLEEIKDFRKCITSNSSKKKIVTSINAVGIDVHFNDNEIFSRDLVAQGLIKKSKPAPDIYIYTAKQMNYNPEQCIVFEDSIAGIQAAKSAGMYTIGCITPSCRDKLKLRKRMDENKADYIVEDMLEVLDLIK